MAAPRKNPPKDAAATIERLAAQGHAKIGIAKQLGASGQLFKRWLEDDGSLQEALELGRETERQALHALIVQSAAANRPANVNAFFILKCRHSYRENDAPSVNVAVGIANVLVVKDHGTDEEWAAKASAQQRTLVSPEPTKVPALLEASQQAFPSPMSASPAVYATLAPMPESIPRLPLHFEPPSWKGRV